MEEGSQKNKINEKSSGASPFSPFPFGSNFQLANRTPFSGSPWQRILLGRTSLGEPTLATPTPQAPPPLPFFNGTEATPLLTPRLKAQELYGGPVMFGTSGNRRTRLLSSTPYSAALRLREKDRLKSRSLSGALPPPATSIAGHSSFLALTGSTARPESASPTDSMSSTARLILDTLDKMSTPLMDARKIPVVGRAEKRKALEEELSCSLGGPSRRRPRLGSGPVTSATYNGSLNGPPLRKSYAPLPAAPGRPQPPPPSLVLRTGPDSLQLLHTTTTNRPTSPASPFRPAVEDISTPLTSAGGKMKSKVSELGKQKADRLSGQEPGPAPLPAYLTQPASLGGLSSLQPPTIRLGPPDVPPPPPSATTAGAASTPAPRATSSAVPIPSANVSSAASLPSSTCSFSSTPAAPVPISAAPRVSSISWPASETPVDRSDKSPVRMEKSSSSTGTVQETVPTTAVGAPVRSFAVAATAGPSTSSGGLPRFRFTELKPVTAVQAVTIVGRQFVFSEPALPAGLSESNRCTYPPGINIRAATASSVTPAPTIATSSSGPRLNNGHSQFSSGKSSVNSWESGSNSGTFSPLVNFKSAAMPDVTNSVKLAKGVDLVQGVVKNSSNSRLPDITASTTTFTFGPARELKTGSVMDILGKKA